MVLSNFIAVYSYLNMENDYNSVSLISNIFLFPGENSEFLVKPYLGIFGSLDSTGKATEAIEFCHRALRILELSRGVDSKKVVNPLYCLGILLLRQGKAKDAKAHFITFKLFFLHFGWMGTVKNSLLS